MRSAVEYGLIAAGIGVGAIAVVRGFAPTTPDPPRFIQLGWRTPIGGIKESPQGVRTAAFYYTEGGQKSRVAVVSCEKPVEKEGKLLVLELSTSTDFGYVIACSDR